MATPQFTFVSKQTGVTDYNVTINTDDTQTINSYPATTKTQLEKDKQLLIIAMLIMMRTYPELTEIKITRA